MDIIYYFDNFSITYSSVPKNGQIYDIKYRLKLIIVASHINFEDLIEHILFCLSSVFWNKKESFGWERILLL